MYSNLILLGIFVLCVLLAGLFAGVEMGVYQLSRLRLRLGIEHKKTSYLLLGKSLRDSTSLIISLLLGTNLSYYFATSSLTYMFLRALENEHAAEAMATVVATPVFFVFSELIPKNFFYYKADRALPAVSWLIYPFDKLARLCGATTALKALSQLSFGRSHSKAVSTKTTLRTMRRGFEALLAETHEEGILSSTQTDMMRRLGMVSHISVRSIMTPMNKTMLVDVNTNSRNLLKVLEVSGHTRYPVYDGWHQNIIGFINAYHCLTDEKEFVNLFGMQHDIHSIHASTNVLDAIDIMQKKNENMMLVTGYGRKPIGILTMKDLVEELLGELAQW